MAISRDYVVWAYRLFLNREPESEAVVQQKCIGYDSPDQLRRDFAASEEFQSAVKSVAPWDASTIVIKELSGGERLFVDIADTFIGVKALDESYEPAERRFIEETVQKGDVALDIGANIGYFAILMASAVGAKGHVHAFEPLRRNSALLGRSITENRFEGRVTLHRAAVGAEPGQLELISPRTTLNWGGAHLRTTDAPVRSDHETSTVPVVALDHLEIRSPVRFIKLDAEGAELLAIRGARALLSRDGPTVLAEINQHQLQTVSHGSADTLIGEMSRHGYRCYPLAPEGIAGEITSYGSDEIVNVVFRR